VLKSPLPGHARLLTRPLRAPVAGATIETTIDRELQFLTESALHEAVRDHDAMGGAAIVMDPHTGEILALANDPTFDLNEYKLASDEALQNRAALHIYEPGSTFKSFIAAAALEVLRMPPTRMFDVSAGYVTFGSRRIHDMHRYGVLSFTDVIVKSSNTGAIKIGQALGSEVVSRYVQRFGFGETLARDIPFQRAGLVDRKLAEFGPSALASVSMGYQIGVTPLQMAAAVGSIANGGELVAPRLVRALVGESGRTEIPRRVVRRTINAETAASLTPILEQVVERGTATAAKIEGYTIAGKTGTAAKLVNGRYSKSEYNASFVGFLPSRNPVLSIVVVIDSPHGNGYMGGAVAAPIFKKIAEASLRHLGVAPTVNPMPPVLVARGVEEQQPILPRPVNYTPATPETVADGFMPDLRGLSAREALRMLTKVGVTARLNGNGFVIEQSPAAGTAFAPGDTCTLKLGRRPIAPPMTGAPQ
jgi:cell division protein FtsI (penicillin-binding protein 3)